jgi:hypothetical protein
LKFLFLQPETYPLLPLFEKPIKKRPFLNFSIGFSQRGCKFFDIWLFCRYELLIHPKAKHKKRSPLCEKPHRKTKLLKKINAIIRREWLGVSGWE